MTTPTPEPAVTPGVPREEELAKIDASVAAGRVTRIAAKGKKPARGKPAEPPAAPQTAPKPERITKTDYRKIKLRDDARLHILVTANPWKPGTKGHGYFQKYEEGLTVAETVKRGVPRGYVQYDIAAERVRMN
jgi:hypothetical protein